MLNIVVIGGTRGIGLQLCRHFAASGHNIALCGRSEKANSVALELAHQFDVKTYGQAIDASDEFICNQFAQSVQRILGHVDVLFANAAVFGPVGPIDNVDISRWVDTLTANALSLIIPIRVFLPSLRNSSNARILTMSGGGLGGPNPIQRASAYLASKSVTASIVESLAQELSEHQITVNAIAPGFFPTDFMHEARISGPDLAGEALHKDASRVIDDSFDETLKQLTSLVDFLISPSAKKVTGRILSARWDKPEKILEMSSNQNAFRLRRVDDELIREAT